MVDSGFSNASLSFVFVENADRFGISQLHQIRGRCGRGKYQGHCYLVPTSFKGLKDKTLTRLKKICETEDGFELSEFDLKSRGSGDLKSDEQAGTEMNLVEWVKEIEIMKEYIKNNLS
jgi:ATP-dependent DNA helicase RecG